MNGLLVMAREPTPGKVKSRLAKDITPERAAALYRAFILDTLEICTRVPDATTWVAYTPDEAEAVFVSLAGGRLIPQGEGSLGDRLTRCLQRLFDEGCEKVVALGSDSPTLPAPTVAKAFESLQEKEVAIGPCLDGGYYLLGLARPQPAILEGISWGTEEVFSQTVRRCETEGLSIATLPTWYDIDTIRGLDLLQAQLEGMGAAGGEGFPRHTYAILQGMPVR